MEGVGERKWPRRRRDSPGPGQPTEEVDVNKSTAHPAHPSTGDRDLRHGQDHPHACMDGYIYLGYTYVSEETGDEVEAYEAIPCRRCTEEAR
jgi:hypothetical protein